MARSAAADIWSSLPTEAPAPHEQSRPSNPKATAVWPHLTPKHNAGRDYEVMLLRHLELCGFRKKGR
jgi:hypothetical protein